MITRSDITRLLEMARQAFFLSPNEDDKLFINRIRDELFEMRANANLRSDKQIPAVNPDSHNQGE